MGHSVEKLQHEVTDLRISVGTILQKAILVANEYKDQRFFDWAKREVNGYGSPDGNAEYRKLKGQYVAVTSDGRTLPIVWDKDDPTLKTRFLTFPIAEIEALLTGSGHTFAVTVNIDPRSLTKIELEPGDRIGFLLTRATLTGFLQAVRQRVLDWTLTLVATPENPQQMWGANMNWDLFISHASEDKDDVARPLADKFIEQGLKVWYDEYTLTVGDSLRRSIDRGLARSRYGLVVLSPHFFEKEWPQKELDGLVAREDGSEKRILPVWHKVNRSDVVAFSPSLADKLGVSTAKGLNHVVQEIMRVFHIDVKQVKIAPAKKKPRGQKRQQSVSAKGTRKDRSALTWIMLDKFFFPAIKVRHGQDGLYTVQIAPANAEEEADLQSLLPSRHAAGGSLPFAARNDAQLIRVKTCEKEMSGDHSVWTLTLAPEDGGFGNSGMESSLSVGGNTYSADDIARLRAGRILVNDPPQKTVGHRGYDPGSLLEGFICGSSSRHPIRQCVLQEVFAKHGKHSYWRELARLQATFLLKASGTVEHVLDLTIGPVRGGKAAVTFRGRRRPAYSNSEPTLIELSGNCTLN